MKKSILAGAMFLIAASASATELQEVTNLYLIGEASPCGWSRDDAPELTKEGDGEFVYRGKLGVGQFKFVVSRSSWESVVSATGDNTTLVTDTDLQCMINPEGGDKDWKWYNNDAGDYVLKINTETGTMTASIDAASLTFASIEHLYIVGDAVATGWDRDNAPELTMVKPGVFEYTGRLNVGEFKFVVSRYSWDSVVSKTDGAEMVEDTPMLCALSTEGVDFKWKNNVEGDYTLTVDCNEKTLTASKVPSTDGVETVDADDADAFIAEGCSITAKVPVRVYDLAGRLVEEIAAGSSTVLPAGIYIVASDKGSVSVCLK